MKKRKEKAFPKFEAKDIDGINCIGFSVVCDLYGIKEERDKIREKMKNSGLDETQLLDKREKTAFLESLKSLEESGYLIKTAEVGEHVTYQCNDATMVENPATGFTEAVVSKTALVKYYKKGHKKGLIEADDPAVSAKVTGMIDQFKNMAGTSEVNDAIKRIIDVEADCVAITRNGNVWFVPIQYADLIDRLQVFIDSLPGQNNFTILPVANRPENRRSFWGSIKNEIGRQIDEARKSIAETKEMIDKGEVQAYRVDNLFALIKEKRERLSAYSALFHAEADDISEELEIINGNLQNLLHAPNEALKEKQRKNLEAEGKRVPEWLSDKMKERIGAATDSPEQ